MIAEKAERIDILIHGVGILISRTEHSTEGIEKDFAIGYLSFMLLVALVTIGYIAFSVIKDPSFFKSAKPAITIQQPRK